MTRLPIVPHGAAAAVVIPPDILEAAGMRIGDPALVQMKLLSNRDQDRLHLRDLIEVDLVARTFLNDLPQELAVRLDALLTESGR